MRARVRPGHPLTVIDVSPGGALVEVERALGPGTRVDVHLETDLRHGTVSARVVRCAVAAIHAEAGITYRAALAFVETCDWMREALTTTGYALHGPLTAPAGPAPASGDGLPHLRDAGLEMRAGVAK